MSFLAILVTGIAVDGAVRFKLDWVEELDLTYLAYLRGQKSYIDSTILVHIFQHQNIVALLILLSVYAVKKFLYSQTRVDKYEPKDGSRSVSF